MAYPKQLISALSRQLNKKLVDYFELENRKYFKDWDDLNHIVEDTLWNYIKNETEKPELKSIYTMQSKMQYQKKKRWIATYKTNKEKYPVTSKNHPFYSIYHDFQARSGHSFHKMTTVTSDNYDSLELKLSRLLYHSLQKERVMLSVSSTIDKENCLQKCYDYSFFQRIVLFKSKKKAHQFTTFEHF